MSPVETLPPDQRAVLQLVLQQGRSYEDLSRLLGISSDAVRGRAVAGLESLGPDAGPRLSAERRGEIVDYLLGQQPDSEREATRERLAGSASARAWARVLAGELGPVARTELPEIPEPQEPTPTPAPARAHAPNGKSATTLASREPAEERNGAGTTERPEPTAEQGTTADGAARAGRLDPAVEEDAAGTGPRASRLGGALLLGAVAILLIVVVIFLVNRGGSSNSGGSASTPSTPSNSASTPANQTPAGGAKTNNPKVVPVAQAALTPPGGGKTPRGAAQLIVQGNAANFLIGAEGLPALKGDSYTVWLYNSPTDATPLAYFRAENIKGGRAGGAAMVPQNFQRFRNIIVSRQAVASPKTPPTKPGPIVLQGPLRYAAKK